jgi:hypothetical protein
VIGPEGVTAIFQLVTALTLAYASSQLRQIKDDIRGVNHELKDHPQ